MDDLTAYLDKHYPFIWTDAEEFFTSYKVPFAAAAICYLPMVFIAQELMKNKQPYSLKLPLMIWNLLLGIGSGLAGYYVITTLIARLLESNFSIMSITCDKLCYLSNASASRWVFFFSTFPRHLNLSTQSS